MKIHMMNMVWAAGQYAFLLPVIVIICGLMIFRMWRMRNALKLLAGLWKQQLFRHVSYIRQTIKVLLMCVGTLFLICALMRPQWNKKEELVAQEGRDLFIALDISRSMLAQDIKPDRITYAKEKIKRLVSLLQAERIGLFLFSGTAFLQCPLTTDYSAFNLYLNQVDVETISSGSTAFDQVLQEAIRVFNRVQGRKHKLLVLVTDGEDFSTQLDSVKQAAIDSGMHIFTLGIGTSDGAPIPVYDAQGNRAGHQKDDAGTIVITRLNEPLLKTLAQDVGGMYIRSTADDTDIKAVVNAVQKFEKEKFDDKKISSLEEQYPYFLLVSFVCFLIEWLI